MFLEILKAILMGIVEGITEWLPISSTGHMILLEQIIKFNASEEFMSMFRVVIQLGAILAVVVLFWNKLWPFGLRHGRVCSKPAVWQLWFKVVAATIPVLIISPLDDWMEAHFYNYITVAAMLILYGVLFLVVESRRTAPHVTHLEQITYRDALIIGVWQMLAIIPGTSRSGATIVGGLLLGLSRACVAEFTFYLAIPVMAGASLLKVLKFAVSGVAITGTEVAKDAAGMVLTDDNFATIVKAVKNGRNVYANIKRAIQFLLSGNTAGILTVLYASLMGLPVPFAAVHLLFINLLTDSLPAIALGMEPHTNEVMSEKPRPRNEGILTKPFLYSVGVEGLVIAAATVTAFYLGLNAGGAAAGQTMAFSTLCLSRLFHGFSCKSQHPVLLTRHFWNNRALLGAFTIGALLLGLVLLVPALEPLFAVAPLSIGMVGAIVGLAFGSMLVIQLLKWIRR